MAEIELVIKVDEDEYKARQRWIANPRVLINAVDKAIANGTVLPEGHGRLFILDEELAKKYFTEFSFSCQKWISEVGISNATLKVIEADKEVKE